MAQLWLSPEKAYRPCGYENKQSLYRDIRLDQFPFPYVRAGKRILISARAIGLITDNAKQETQEGDQSLTAAAPTCA